MKETRLCDNRNIETTAKLCTRNNLGMEICGFIDPYTKYRKELLEKYTKLLFKIYIGKSFHAPFWYLDIGTKMKLLRQEIMDIFNYAYNITKELRCTEIVVYNGYIQRVK